MEFERPSHPAPGATEAPRPLVPDDVTSALASTVDSAHALAEAGAVFAGWLLLVSGLERANPSVGAVPAWHGELLGLYSLALEVYEERWWGEWAACQEQETVLLGICADRALQQAYALAVERRQWDLAVCFARARRATAYRGWIEGMGRGLPLEDHFRTAATTQTPNLSPPVHELEAVGQFAVRAIHLAQAGRLADGYTLLLTGYERARFHTSAPWGPSLVQGWEDVLWAYCERFGVRD